MAAQSFPVAQEGQGEAAVGWVEMAPMASLAAVMAAAVAISAGLAAQVPPAVSASMLRQAVMVRAEAAVVPVMVATVALAAVGAAELSVTWVLVMPVSGLAEVEGFQLERPARVALLVAMAAMSVVAGQD
jgi:hypothetical protein